MSKLPSMPFLVDAYMADTTHLSLEEHGAYLLLLFSMWRRDGYIDDNDRDNARMLGVGPGVWLRLKPRLMPMLTVIGGRITQKNLQRQWNYAQENRIRQSEKGKAGAKARSERKQGLDSIRGLGRGVNTASSTGQSSRSTVEEASLSIKVLPSSNSITVKSSEESKEPTANSAAVDLPEIPAHLRRLMNTKIMKGQAA